MKFRTLTFPFLVLAFLLCLNSEALAVDLTVNLTTDEHDAAAGDGVCEIAAATGQCTLRAAIEEANALASNDRVLFSLPTPSTITLTSANGEIPIIASSLAGTLEIRGSGANNLTIHGGAGTNRIFYLIAATVTISGVTLTGGNGDGVAQGGNGGAILASDAALTLDRVHVTGNTAAVNGGAIYLNGGSNHHFRNSTFSFNAADSCGAIAVVGGLSMVNSTISGNTASNQGGGLCNSAGSGTTIIRNVTVTNNSASSIGGGIVQLSGTLILGNTIVAGNNAPGNIAPDLWVNAGTAQTEGGNLIGNNSGATGFPDGNPNGNGDIVGTFAAPINPLLGPLQNNGGRTPTHAILMGSPAIDSGFNANAVDPVLGPLRTDQRGFARIVDGDTNGSVIVDIGAYEFLAPSAATITVSGRVRTEFGRGIAGVVVTALDSRGNTLTARTNGFGYYAIEGLRAGETYVFSVAAKRFRFSPRVVTVNDELTDLDFVPDS